MVVDAAGEVVEAVHGEVVEDASAVWGVVGAWDDGVCGARWCRTTGAW